MKWPLINCLLGCLLVFSCGASEGISQEPGKNQPQGSGIYLTQTDYKLGKLALAVDCQHERNRIHYNELLGKPYITVTHEGKKYVYPKDSIFGLRDCSGHDFRFFHKQVFEIEEPNTIVVYRQLKLDTGLGNKSVKPVPVYFFSHGLEAPILPLTRPALEAVFADNDKFHDLLEIYYKDDLSSYDAYRHSYKVNLLLQAAK